NRDDVLIQRCRDASGKVEEIGSDLLALFVGLVFIDDGIILIGLEREFTSAFASEDKKDEFGRSGSDLFDHPLDHPLGYRVGDRGDERSEEHTSELQSRENLVC